MDIYQGICPWKLQWILAVSFSLRWEDCWMELASEVINPTPDSELRELYAELSLSQPQLELYTESSTNKIKTGAVYRIEHRLASWLELYAEPSTTWNSKI